MAGKVTFEELVDVLQLDKPEAECKLDGNRSHVLCQKLDKWEDNCEETSVLLERLISEYPSVLRRGFSHDPAGVILAPYWSLISILICEDSPLFYKFFRMPENKPIIRALVETFDSEFPTLQDLIHGVSHSLNPNPSQEDSNSNTKPLAHVTQSQRTVKNAPFGEPTVVSGEYNYISLSLRANALHYIYLSLAGCPTHSDMYASSNPTARSLLSKCSRLAVECNALSPTLEWKDMDNDSVPEGIATVVIMLGALESPENARWMLENVVDQKGHIFYAIMMAQCAREGCTSRVGLSKCGRCRALSYCCQKHQKEDWRTHQCKCFESKW